jgi:hypothetical protein
VRPPLIACPGGCGLELPEDELRAQAEHMVIEHPEIVEQRRAEARRWDGWEDE